MKRFPDVVLKVNRWREAVAGLALTFIITSTTADVVLRAIKMQQTSRSFCSRR